MIRAKRIILVFNMFLCFAIKSNGLDNTPNGFLWYKEVRSESRSIDNDKAFNMLAKRAKSRRQKLSKHLEMAIDIMLDTPSIENVLRAQRIQRQIMDRSEQVGKIWAFASLFDAGLVNRSESSNVLHRAIYSSEENIILENYLKSIAGDWAIIFYVAKNCPYCKAFIPIVESFRTDYGLQVIALSEEGGDYGPFEGRKNKGRFNYLNPDMLSPILFLMHRSGFIAGVIARGITSKDQISRNIQYQIENFQASNIGR